MKSHTTSSGPQPPKAVSKNARAKKQVKNPSAKGKFDLVAGNATWRDLMIVELISALYPSCTKGRDAPVHFGAVVGYNLLYAMQGHDTGRHRITIEPRSGHAIVTVEVEKPPFDLMAPGIEGQPMKLTQQLSLATLGRFLRGLSSAVCKGSTAPSPSMAGQTLRTRLLQTLVSEPALVDSCATIEELHRKLCAKFGANSIGSYDRLEKVCNEFGLRFRPPGRPRGSRKTPKRSR